jgi:hypothetical protein
MSGQHDTADRPDLTKAELAKFLGKSQRHVSDLVTGQKIGFYWAGNGRDPRFPFADVLAYREQLRRQNRVEPKGAPAKRRKQTPERYTQAVKREQNRRTNAKAAVP